MSADSLPPVLTSRRKFLQAGITATLASAASPAMGAARVVDSEPASASSAAKVDVNFHPNFDVNFELDEITIDDLQKAFQSGHLSSRSVTEKYLARIAKIDKAGPMLNSIIELNPDALQIA